MITYELSGPLDLLKIPKTVNNPLRKNRLWEKTCFELFIGSRGSDPYWEVNLSPSGHWNIYRLDAYRKGMTEDANFSTLPFFLTCKNNFYRVELKINRKRMLPLHKNFQIGVSTVIEDKNGDMTYWALNHPGEKPDFHHPDSFILEL